MKARIRDIRVCKGKIIGVNLDIPAEDYETLDPRLPVELTQLNK